MHNVPTRNMKCQELKIHNKESIPYSALHKSKLTPKKNRFPTTFYSNF